VVKVVVNMGVGDAARDAKLINGAVNDLSPDHRPEARDPQARKSIAQFKLREGMPIGARSPARRPHVGVPRPADLDRAAAYPRLPRPVAQAVRRQRQLHLRSHEQSVFHEIDVDTIDRPRHGHHRRHHGDERRRRTGAAAALGFPFKEN
jgi:large subunit ribosomal protein L5